MTTQFFRAASLFDEERPSGPGAARFTGNPTSMRSLAERLARGGFSVELPRLPGTHLVEDMMTPPGGLVERRVGGLRRARAAFEQSRRRGTLDGGGLTAYIGERRDPAALVFINPVVMKPATSWSTA